MGENPSSPGDGLEDALRRALSDAVGRIEPGTDGLDSIRARIGRRPPRPWLLAVLSGAVERARSWTWRGHWAWPGWPLARTHLTRRGRRPRHRKGTPAEKPSRRGDRLPLLGALGALGGWRTGWLTLAAGFAGIALIASVSFGVQPVRQTIIQAGTTVLHGDGAYPPPPPWGGGGTDGAGTQTTAGPARWRTVVLRQAPSQARRVLPARAAALAAAQAVPRQARDRPPRASRRRPALPESRRRPRRTRVLPRRRGRPGERPRRGPRGVRTPSPRA